MQTDKAVARLMAGESPGVLLADFPKRVVVEAQRRVATRRLRSRPERVLAFTRIRPATAPPKPKPIPKRQPVTPGTPGKDGVKRPVPVKN